MKNVTVTLKATSALDSDTPEVFTYSGKYEQKNGKDYVMYEETEPKVKTIVKVDKSEVIISRSGEMKSTLKIIENERHDTVYSTPYGPFPMTVYGIAVDNRLEDNFLSFEYQIENNGVIAHNRIEITLKEV